jgi:hypothetical protein
MDANVNSLIREIARMFPHLQVANLDEIPLARRREIPVGPCNGTDLGWSAPIPPGSGQARQPRDGPRKTPGKARRLSPFASVTSFQCPVE